MPLQNRCAPLLISPFICSLLSNVVIKIIDKEILYFSSFLFDFGNILPCWNGGSEPKLHLKALVLFILSRNTLLFLRHYCKMIINQTWFTIYNVHNKLKDLWKEKKQLYRDENLFLLLLKFCNGFHDNIINGW